MFRPHIGGASGEGWKGLHSGWGYRPQQLPRINGNGIGRKRNGNGVPSFLRPDPRLTDPSQQIILQPRVDKKRSGLLTLKNGGQGNGKPVLVHKGELVIGNPYRRRP